jgi:hypothetical protein
MIGVQPAVRSLDSAAGSACPRDIVPINGNNPTSIEIELLGR